jgi:hypothetical protein
VERNRQRKLTACKDSKEIQKKTLTKHLSKFYESFASGHSVKEFETVSLTNDIGDTSIRRLSTVSFKSDIKKISASHVSTFLVSSYKSAYLYSASDSNLSMIKNISIAAPYDKGTLTEDSMFGLFYGNSGGLNIYDFESETSSNCRKLNCDPTTKLVQVEWSKSDHSIFALSSEGCLVHYDDRILKPLSFATTGVSAIPRTVSGGKYFIGMCDGSIQMLDIRKKGSVSTIGTALGRITSICPISENECAAGHESGYISVTQIHDQITKHFGNFTTSISNVSYDSSSNMLIACSKDTSKAVKLLHMENFRWEHLSSGLTVPSHTNHSIFLANSNKFILASNDSVHIYSY